MGKYRAVVFDLDGTLLDTLDDLMDGVNLVMRKYGYPERTRDEIRRFIGNGILKLMERSVPENTPEEVFKNAFADFKDYYTAHCREKTKPFDGIIPLLTELKARKLGLAIVSNKNNAAVKSLSDFYFTDLIAVSIGDREGIRKKPCPDTLLQAMIELGISPEDTLYVGDSEVDKQTADNAGVDCVLVAWGFREKAFLLTLGADAVVNTPDDILKYIG